jgi:predicted DNA-binding transcriptional regulator AlpA
MNSPVSSQDDRLIDFQETAHLLGDISERSVRRLIVSGELPQPVKVLSAPRLYQSEVKAYLERLKNKRPSRQR